MTNPFEEIEKGVRLKTMSDVLAFGKYKDEIIGDIFEIDPQYLRWCLENIDTFKMNKKDEKEIFEAATEADYDNGIDCDDMGPEFWKE